MAGILIADDSDTVRSIMKEMLENSGHNVVGEAKNGLEAVLMFEELRPDITTLDIAMPVMDGMEALNKIMEIDDKARIVMVSSANQDGNIPKSIISGACDFVEKPFVEETLLGIISRIEA